jgi:hypothetical protein
MAAAPGLWERLPISEILQQIISGLQRLAKDLTGPVTDSESVVSPMPSNPPKQTAMNGSTASRYSSTALPLCIALAVVSAFALLAFPVPGIANLQVAVNAPDFVAVTARPVAR